MTEPDIKKALEQVDSQVGNALRQLGDVPLKPTPPKVEVLQKDNGCVVANGMLICKCGKCEPEDYKLPADFPTPPKGDWECLEHGHYDPICPQCLVRSERQRILDGLPKERDEKAYPMRPYGWNACLAEVKRVLNNE